MTLVYTKRQENLDRLCNLEGELQSTYDEIVQATRNVDQLHDLIGILSDLVDDAQLRVNLDDVEF
jgi:GTP1/Obg family GTP-binding protein